MKNYLKNFMIFQINNIEYKNIIYTKSIHETYLQDNKLWFSQVNEIRHFFPGRGGLDKKWIEKLQALFPYTPLLEILGNP